MKPATLPPSPLLRPSVQAPAAGDLPGQRCAAARISAVLRHAHDLIALTKPRVISLLLLITLIPMFLAPGAPPDAWLVVWTVVGGYLMAGGANAINMWADRDIDREMGRTRRRPIPSGRMRPLVGLFFGIALGSAAFALLWAAVNPLAAVLALAGLLFYVFVYTLALKRSSPQNIVIGGAAGAFPPLVGWAAVAGKLDVTALLLFAIVFYWTPPHFWALALVKRRDYALAGVPMLPVVRGQEETRRQILLYTLMLLPLTTLPVATGAFGAVYGVVALGLGGWFLRLALDLLGNREDPKPAWRLYKYSLLYLALLFAAMVLDRILQT